jgi:hypothetical protein
VISLVSERLSSDARLPQDIRNRFESEAQRIALADLAREAELRALLDACSSHGIDVLLVKGSHLAYAHYARPDLRARIDTDLLVARADRERAGDLLTRELGYVADAKVAGDLSATQRLYVLTRDGIDVHLVDLHWRLASPQVFAHVLTFEELHERSVPIPELGSSARGPSIADALLIACMHRIAHHHDEAEQFKWLYDLHVLASQMTEADWTAFSGRAAERGIASVTLDALERAAFWFHTRVPDRIRVTLRSAAAANREETAAFLAVRPKAQEVLDDLRALPSWSARVRLLREHLFPGELYMREVYAPRSGMPLPMLYVWRIVRGAGKWMRTR